MKRNQVFVRAKSPSGKWGAHDVLDLEQESFNAFVAGKLYEAGIVVGYRPETIKGKEIEYKSKVEEREDYEDS